MRHPDVIFGAIEERIAHLPETENKTRLLELCAEMGAALLHQQQQRLERDLEDSVRLVERRRVLPFTYPNNPGGSNSPARFSTRKENL